MNDDGPFHDDSGESGARSVDGTDRCYNPLCEEELTCDPGDKEGYCSWECAVMARSGQANRILREQRELATDGGTVEESEDPWAEWIEYQQNEIDGAHERIKDRMGHVAGTVENGILNASHVQEHQNDRLEAYLEGYSDALEFAASEVSQIDNLVKYAESATQDGDSA